MNYYQTKTGTYKAIPRHETALSKGERTKNEQKTKKFVPERPAIDPRDESKIYLKKLKKENPAFYARVIGQ